MPHEKYEYLKDMVMDSASSDTHGLNLSSFLVFFPADLIPTHRHLPTRTTRTGTRCSKTLSNQPLYRATLRAADLRVLLESTAHQQDLRYYPITSLLRLHHHRKDKWGLMASARAKVHPRLLKLHFVYLLICSFTSSPLLYSFMLQHPEISSTAATKHVDLSRHINQEAGNPTLLCTKLSSGSAAGQHETQLTQSTSRIIHLVKHA